MARPRVLLLITLSETGGAQRYVAALLPALAGEYDVVVAAQGDGFLADASRQAGVRYLPLRHMQRAIHPLRDVLALVELFRLFRRERPLVVHANSSKAGILGRLAAVAARVPVRLLHRPRLGVQGPSRARGDRVPVGRPPDEPAHDGDDLRGTG